MSMRKLSTVLFVLLFALLFVGGSAFSARADAQKFIVSVDNIAHYRFTDSGVFNTPVGASGPGALLPGEAYQWSFYANPGEKLSFATMFVQSNDWFIAPDELGIPLYTAGGTPMSGNVTHYVKLWDVGSEGDQVPGMGADQAPRQAGPDTGPDDPTEKVRQVLSAALPAVDELVQVSLQPGANGHFTLRIENVSGGSSLPTPLAPGVGVVHSDPAPLFIQGTADWGQGLEALAEDGDPSALAAVLSASTGINTPLAPVAWTVHRELDALFIPGQAASAGLESLAEDGSPVMLVASLGDSNSGAAAIGRGASEAAPIFAPTGNYSFEITAVPGDHLSFASMFVQSNDWFYALTNQPLFDLGGDPIEGSVTHQIKLYDAGTEFDETPGFGPHQPPRQAGANSGPSQGGVVTQVTTGGFTNPAAVIHVTITPVNN